MRNIAIIFFTGVAFFSSVAIAQNSDEQSNVEPLATIETIEVKDKTTDSKAELLEQVREHLNQIQSLKANFSQQNPNGGIATGTMHMERPGKVRFEYDGDVPILIVSDGNILNMIDYDIGQVTKWPVNDTPLALLLSDEIVFNEHTSISDVQNNFNSSFVTVTSLDPSNPQQGSLTLILTLDAENNLGLRAWQVVDAQGMLTTVSIANVEVNGVLDETLWAFEDPRGNRLTRQRRR